MSFFGAMSTYVLGADTLPDLLHALGLPAVVVAVVVLILALPPLLSGMQVVGRLVRAGVGWLKPSRYRKATRDELDARRRIARLLLQNLDLLEEELHWQGSTFADLSVSIESWDTPRRVRVRLFSFRRIQITFRTHSLSKALEREQERITLLQGAPGSGKSVAVRHYARLVLEKAAQSRFRRTPLALCVSLRDFEVGPEQVTAEALRAYVIDQVNLQGARELGEYLEGQLTADIAAGDVVLLLDSFDEIPSVLGTRNIDAAILPYVKAISNLMGGGAARCLIASREYKGPRVEGWTRLELVGLGFDEQLQLLANYGLGRTQIEIVEPLLFDPRAGFSADMRNPLNLTLLAQFVELHARAPARPSELFDDYVARSLQEAAVDDEISTEPLVQGLERYAFGLMRRPEAGLTGRPDELVGYLESEGCGSQEVANLMDVVNRSRLLIEIPKQRSKPERLAFVHRRVQEYFATEQVRRHPDDLAPRDLARNPRWRETAVTLLQVASHDSRESLTRELAAVLDAQIKDTGRHPNGEFFWASETVHALELIVAAYGTDPRSIPSELYAPASELVEEAWKHGTISDRKFALDCLPAMRADMQPRLINRAFGGSSDWLRTSALRDCTRLHPLPDQLDTLIRRLLITLMAGGRLSRDAPLLDGDLRRLYDGRKFVSVRRTLVAIPATLIAICLVHVVYDLGSEAWSVNLYSLRFEILWWIFVPFAIFWIFQSTEPVSFGNKSPVRRFFERVMRRGFGWQVDEFESEAFAMALVGVVVLATIGDVAQCVIDGVRGRYLTAAGDLVIRPALAAYAIAWGPTMLVAVHQRWLGERMRPWQAAFVFTKAIPDLRRRLEFARPVARAMLVSLVLQAIGVGMLLGLFWVLDHLAGDIGHGLVVGMRWLLLALFPLLIVIALLREVRSRARVRRGLRATRSVTPEVLLERLASFREASEAAAYLEILRARHADELRKLPRQFVRDLMRVIEAPVDGARSVLGELHPAVAALQLSTSKRLLRSGEVLDELGKLDEFLRAR